PDSAQELGSRPPVVAILAATEMGPRLRPPADALRTRGLWKPTVWRHHPADWCLHPCSCRRPPRIDNRETRGASATDASPFWWSRAEDGVMPQTLESLRYISAAGVPMVVAVTRCGGRASPRGAARLRHGGAQASRRRTGLKSEATSSGVPVSALKGSGVFERLCLRPSWPWRELLELRANVQGRAEASVYRVRALAKPSLLCTRGCVKPGTVLVAGPRLLPAAWLIMSIRERRRHKASDELADTARQLMDSKHEPRLSLTIRADADGSLEAILGLLSGYADPRCHLRPASSRGPPTISEWRRWPISTAFCAASMFRCRRASRQQAAAAGVPVWSTRVVYHMIADAEGRLTAALPPKEEERPLGSAECCSVPASAAPARWQPPQSGRGGCACKSGQLSRKKHFGWWRNGQTVFTGRCAKPAAPQSTVETVRSGMECGVQLDLPAPLSYLPGDQIVCFETVAGILVAAIRATLIPANRSTLIQPIDTESQPIIRKSQIKQQQWNDLLEQIIMIQAWPSSSATVQPPTLSIAIQPAEFHQFATKKTSRTIDLGAGTLDRRARATTRLKVAGISEELHSVCVRGCTVTPELEPHPFLLHGDDCQNGAIRLSQQVTQRHVNSGEMEI
uniref:IF-2 domain-containing protein n=1 Tax=Macrostomum lignano TaxID=282301 RepID=A0A1I8FHE9_9PLAT